MNDPSVRLICIAAYHNTATGERYARSDVLEVTSARAAFLLVDAPGCFRYDDVRPELAVEAVTPAFVGGNVVVFDAVLLAGQILPGKKRSRG